MRVTPLTWVFLGIAFVATTSVLAQTQSPQSGGTVAAPGATMAPPAPARPGGHGATNITPGGLTATALTTSECKQLGGQVARVSVKNCRGGRLCTTTDRDGTMHSACITVKP
jgi:hypothetical protein